MEIAISLKKPDAKPSHEQPKRFSQAAQENSNKECTSIHIKEPSITRGILQLGGDCCGKLRKLEVYEAPKQLRP